MSGILIDLRLPSADSVVYTVHVFCLRNCVLCLVIRLYYGFTLLVYVRFFVLFSYTVALIL